jgi:hypothetical protein
MGIEKESTFSVQLRGKGMRERDVLERTWALHLDLGVRSPPSAAAVRLHC